MKVPTDDGRKGDCEQRLLNVDKIEYITKGDDGEEWPPINVKVGEFSWGVWMEEEEFLDLIGASILEARDD